jgi:hypothetical protein
LSRGGGTISGTIKAADVIGVAGGAAQGIGNGDFDDLVREFERERPT